MFTGNPINCIYKLTAPNGKVYIGQTQDLAQRAKVYARAGCVNQTKLLHSIQKYGFDTFKVEILDNYFGDDTSGLDALETYYITMNDACGENGLNILPNGGCTRGVKRTDTTKQRMSQSSKGKPKSENHRASLRKVFDTRKNIPGPTHAIDELGENKEVTPIRFGKFNRQKSKWHLACNAAYSRIKQRESKEWKRLHPGQKKPNGNCVPIPDSIIDTVDGIKKHVVPKRFAPIKSEYQRFCTIAFRRLSRV